MNVGGRMDLMSVLVSTVACTMPAAACDAQAVTGLDARLIQAVCLVESSGNESAYNGMDGYTPSYGACQIKYETARHLGFLGSKSELMMPGNNYLFAAKYLKKQLYRYRDVKKAISAYNAGHAIIYNEGYVQKVLTEYNRLSN
jgi:soluble lytic murein transglycosylase-like protein